MPSFRTVSVFCSACRFRRRCQAAGIDCRNTLADSSWASAPQPRQWSSLQVLDGRGDYRSLLRARASINTLAQLAPDAAKEIALVQQGAALYEKFYRTELGYLNALWVFGNLYRTQQQPAQAQRYFQAAIDGFDQVGSRDYTNLGASYGLPAFIAACMPGFCIRRVSGARHTNCLQTSGAVAQEISQPLWILTMRCIRQGLCGWQH